MTIGGFVAVAGPGLAAASLLMACAIVGLKLHRTLRERAGERRVAPLRAAVLLVATGEDTDDGAMLATLAGVRGRARRDLDDLVVRLLGKVRGEAAEQLVDLLRTHGVLDRAARDATSWSAVRRERALHLIGRCRDWRGTDVAIAALEDRSPRVRAQAARTVGRIGDPRAARPLLHALRLEGIHVGDAAEALVGLGHDAGEALLWALAEGSPRARTVAAHLCGVGGVRAAAPLLVELVEQDDDLTVASAAVTALGKVGRPQDVGAIAAATVHFHPQQLRRAATQALGEIGLAQAVPVLVRLLADPTSQVAEAAARSLLGLGAVGRAALVGHAHLPAAGAELTHARLTGVAV
ncbi:HEAT repeat domain-containing protein [Phycicoccus sonneratiae]|uniref:HEAT repeat domain-containing protein n=1 Tax=Phycicoccus sonneratiae TaxID=2807628 RepID=A0ABS2CL93_9MICO|nr:HEAT repeat domain-containing protein [Phycicoccus sonneraticus]MBM6400653.1 HEAT repeat domain-containing protein [Phycicoccus sonneraticus]